MKPEPSFIPAQDHPFPDGLVVWRKREDVVLPVIIDGPGFQYRREHFGDGDPVPWLPGDLIAPVAGQWVPVPDGIDPERLVGERVRREYSEYAIEFVVEGEEGELLTGQGMRAYTAKALVSPEALARITADPDADLIERMARAMDMARLTPEERAEIRKYLTLLDDLDAVEAERDALRERLAYVEELARGWAEHESSGPPPRVVGAIFLDAVRDQEVGRDE